MDEIKKEIRSDESLLTYITNKELELKLYDQIIENMEDLRKLPQMKVSGKHRYYRVLCKDFVEKRKECKKILDDLYSLKLERGL